MKKNQNGFSVIEVLVVIFIVGLVAAVGWLVYDRQQRNTDSISAVPTSQTSETDNKVEQDPDAEEAARQTLAFYHAYAGSGLGGKDPKLTLGELQQKGYITAEAVTAINAVEGLDAVLCAQDGSTNLIETKESSLSGDVANVTVTQKFDVSTNNISVELIRTPKAEQSWTITKITCAGFL